MVQFTEETSAQGGGMEMIPAGTLVWLAASVRGMKNSNATGGQMADMEFVITEGAFTRRKIWMYLMDPDDGRNSEAARTMSQGHLCRMLESTGVCIPGQMQTYQQHRIATLQGCVETLEAATAAGRKIAAKLGIQPAKDGYAAKQVIECFVSPNPKSGSTKEWERLKSGDTAPPAGAAAAATRAVQPSFGTPAAVAAPGGFGAPAARPSALAPPSWAGAEQAAPAAGGAAAALGNDDIPF